MLSPTSLHRPPVYGKICPEYSTTKTNSTDDCLALSEALTGHWVGLMPLHDMFAKFFPGVSLPDSADIKCPDYTAMTLAKDKSDKCKAWAMATLRGRIPDNVAISVYTDRSVESSDLEPNIALHIRATGPTSQSQLAPVVDGPFPFDTVDVVCEFCDDLPFLSRRGQDHLESIEKDGGDAIRGRLASFAKKHFEQQHRLFLWHVVLGQKQAHLVRWDHAGAIVSEGFDPTVDPWIFHLLRAYTQAKGEEQGLDPTARLAKMKHEQIFRSALDYYSRKSQSLGRKATPHVESSAVEGSPVYRLDVSDSTIPDGVRPCLVSRPFHVAHSPVGRSTRVYLSYDLAGQRLRILKDAWRPEYEGCLPEYSAYERMKEDAFIFVPKVECGGDVSSGPGASSQTTATQDLAFGEETAAWRQPCAAQSKFRKLVHYRILEDLSLPLQQLDSSRQLLSVMRDIATAMQAAKDGAKLMHRDITWFNLQWAYDYLSGSINGILIDWDHAERTDLLAHEYAPNTSATWHFMPIRLIDDPEKVHDFIDEMESLYWSLLFGALRFVEHDNPFILLGDKDFFTSFDDLYDFETDQILKMEARDKRQWLLDGRWKAVKWRSANFTKFMHSVAEVWARFYRLVDLIKTDDDLDVPDPTEWDLMCEELSSADWFIIAIRKALAQDPSGWPNDIVPNRFPKRTTEDVQALRRALRTGNFDTGRMSVDSRMQMAVVPGQCFQDPHSRSLLDVAKSLKRQSSTRRNEEALDPTFFPVIGRTQGLDDESLDTGRPTKVPHVSHHSPRSVPPDHAQVRPAGPPPIIAVDIDMA